jgi:pyruvate dehydrogenase E2 component (dihydrolipoamide acetyltransferase)
MAVSEYKLPDVGEGLTEAEIVSWKVKVGDTIKVNDVVVEIETAKSLVELPSPYAGTVTALLVEEGQTVQVGTPMIAVSSGDPGEGDDAPMPTLVGYGPRTASSTRRPRSGGAVPPSSAGATAQEQLQGAFTPVPEAMALDDVDAAEEPAVPAATPPRSAEQPLATEDSQMPAAGSSGVRRVLAKPPVRKLAKELGVDLQGVEPTGPAGTLTRADVESAAALLAGVSPSGDGLSDDDPQAAGRRETREPIKGVRRHMAQAMVRSAFTAPHVTEWVSVDATKTMKYVDRLRSHRDFAELKVSPLLLVAKAVCLAARRTPVLNAAWDEEAQEVVYRSYVNLGIAAATPRGLVVPNIKDADTLSLPELASAVAALTTTAREGRTQPAEMSGGTFTITNVGVFGIDAGTPILNPGESGILCVGAIRQQPWVHRGKVKPRWVTTLALSFDHRLVDGESGSRFLADVASIVEDPSTALLF